jgi:hypothetical protein
MAAKEHLDREGGRILATDGTDFTDGEMTGSFNKEYRRAEGIADLRFEISDGG